MATSARDPNNDRADVAAGWTTTPIATSDSIDTAASCQRYNDRSVRWTTVNAYTSSAVAARPAPLNNPPARLDAAAFAFHGRQMNAAPAPNNKPLGAGERRQVQQVDSVGSQRTGSCQPPREQHHAARHSKHGPPDLVRCLGFDGSTTRRRAATSSTTAPPPPSSTGGAAARSFRSTAHPQRSDPSWRSRRCPGR